MSVLFFAFCAGLLSPFQSVAASNGIDIAVLPHEQSIEVVYPETSQSNASKAGEYSSDRTVTFIKTSLENFFTLLAERLDTLIFTSVPNFPEELSKAVDILSVGGGFTGLLYRLLVLSGVFLLAFIGEYLVYHLLLSRFAFSATAKENGLSFRLIIALLQVTPSILRLVVFTAASYGFYSLLYSEIFTVVCPLYVTILSTLLIGRSFSLLLTFLFSPGNSAVRLFPLPAELAICLYKEGRYLIWLAGLGFMLFSLLTHAGLAEDSLILVRLLMGIVFIGALTLSLNRNRNVITALIEKQNGKVECGWFCKQLAAKWYYMSLGYTYCILAVWIVRLVVIGPEFIVAFAASLFIVPLFFLFDTLLQATFSSILAPPGSSLLPGMESEQEREQSLLVTYIRILLRVLLGLALGLWLLHLWGRGVVIGPVIRQKGVEVFFILGCAYVCWQIINTLISGYLLRHGANVVEPEVDMENDWGGGPLLDRTQTLLPMIRKGIGAVLCVFMLLLILSSIGVNIAPLLAGAGVVGIALGFGAQKLVSDILSGLFCLVDDAFRVGEYIEAGTIAGSVERITMRNVMLRHHRGMLQIIPYSELGAITNYMRGGIIVKFNLQFAYDTDVEQVRKIIKKVGRSMLEDPEYVKKFIKQVKSQGIREVGDSVLTIRVKFTAKPGTHFVIRREAYRRITEALVAKGIHYAHRKVIVELPEKNQEESQGLSDAAVDAVKAGAAAQQAIGGRGTEHKAPVVLSP